MDARQGKRLVAAAQRALAMLDPEWVIAEELRSAILGVSAAVVVKRSKARRDLSAGAVPGAARAEGGIIWRLLLERACKACGHDSTDHKPEKRVVPSTAKDWRHRETEHRTIQVCECGCEDYKPTVAHKPNICVQAAKLEEQRKALSICACGHVADQHEQDALDNLLACKMPKRNGGTCDCDHFHYGSAAEQAAA